MSSRQILSSVAAISMLAGAIVSSVAFAQEWKGNVDWIRNQDQPKKVRCIKYVVRQSPLIERGNTTGGHVFSEAVKAAKAGDANLAMGWIKSGQCHNPSVQNQFDANRNAILNYLKTQ